MEAERNRQQLTEAEGCRQHQEVGGNQQQLLEREIYEMRGLNFEEEEEEDHQLEALREEGSSSDKAVICVERMSSRGVTWCCF